MFCRFCPLLSAVLLAAQEPIRMGDFSSGNLSLVGSARRVGQVLRLTPGSRFLSGAAWHPEKQHVAGGFDTTFRFQFTNQGGNSGADGLAFVLQTQGPRALGAVGAAGGFAAGDAFFDPRGEGIPLSLALFFDTYRNAYGGDPSDNFVVVCANGRAKEMRWPPRWIAVRDLRGIKLKDRKVHTARILYDPPSLSLELDGRMILQATVNLRAVTGEDGSAYVGFTASTGAGYQNHDVLSWQFRELRPRVNSDASTVSSNISFLKSACQPDRTLCTPEEPSVETTGPRSYHVVLPADREWGVSVPNPSGAAVRLSNLSGTVCWEPPRDVFTGCNGPEGSRVYGSGKALAFPSQPPGSLIQRNRNGKTEFSINDTPGRFSDNAGLFEFDVTVIGAGSQ